MSISSMFIEFHSDCQLMHTCVPGRFLPSLCDKVKENWTLICGKTGQASKHQIPINCWHHNCHWSTHLQTRHRANAPHSFYTCIWHFGCIESHVVGMSFCCMNLFFLSNTYFYRLDTLISLSKLCPESSHQWITYKISFTLSFHNHFNQICVQLTNATFRIASDIELVWLVVMRKIINKLQLYHRKCIIPEEWRWINFDLPYHCIYKMFAFHWKMVLNWRPLLT